VEFFITGFASPGNLTESWPPVTCHFLLKVFFLFGPALLLFFDCLASRFKPPMMWFFRVSASFASACGDLRFLPLEPSSEFAWCLVSYDPFLLVASNPEVFFFQASFWFSRSPVTPFDGVVGRWPPGGPRGRCPFCGALVFVEVAD